MKKLFVFFLLLTVFASWAYAQLNGDGYYRVQNQKTERYMSLVDNRGSINVQTTDADFGALRTVMGFERVVSDPATVIYIKKMTVGYDVQCQDAGSFDIIGYELRLLDLKNGTYAAYATAHGLTKYLSDAIPSWMMDEEEKIYGSVGTNDKESRYWYIIPVKSNSDCYFGIKPDIAVAGSYYKSFYASFPFSFASNGMKAYYVTNVDCENGCAVVSEVDGVIPSATPLIVECSSEEPSDNKLNLLTSTAKAPSDNKLKGVYFCNPDAGINHTNVVSYNSSTMRVLGKAADGSLAFIKQSGLKYIPANTAYLTVPAGSPDVLKVMTEAEYQEALTEEVTIIANNYTRTYGDSNPVFEFTTEGADLIGTPVLSCDASERSTKGTYPIKVSKGSVVNTFANLVNGVLTVTPAELTVTVADAEREQGEDNPEFVLIYDGFKNGETESSLAVRPRATTTATKDSPAGVYDITVDGGSAYNYQFNYVSGKLTVKVPDAIKDTKTVSVGYDVYDAYGKKILTKATSLVGLRKGVYIINGRKYVIR